VLLVPAAGAAAALLLVARHGVFLSADGLSYVGTARNLLDGHGLRPPPGSPPPGQFPPLYPLVLAAGGRLSGADPLTVARYANPLLAAATVLLVGAWVRRATGSVGRAVAAQVAVATAVDVLTHGAGAQSEPLFVLLALGALALMSGGRWRAAAGLAAAACLTRYVGVAVVAAGAAGLVSEGRPRRWRWAAVWSGAALAPTGLWLAWAGSAGGRTAALHLPGLDYLDRGVRNVGLWLAPSAVPWPVRDALAAAAVVALVAVARTHRRPPATRVLGLFAAAYLAAVLLQRALFEVSGRLDTRFLLVLHVAAVMAVASVRHRLAPALVWAAVLAQLPGAVGWIADGSTPRRPARYDGYAARMWSEAVVMGRVRALPPGERVTTNLPAVVYFHTGRVAQRLPLDWAVRQQGATGVVAYFTASAGGGRFFSPPVLAGWTEVGRDRVGALYRPT
jgi:hypothetical protein